MLRASAFGAVVGVLYSVKAQRRSCRSGVLQRTALCGGEYLQELGTNASAQVPLS